MAENFFFGWDLLFNSVKSKINGEADVIIVLAHWCLIKESFLCLGIGTDKTLLDTDVGNEQLPDSWNEIDENVYSLRYVRDKKLFILLGTKTDNNIILNFFNPDSRDTSNMSIEYKNEVKSINGPLKTMIPKCYEIVEKIKKELIKPICGNSTSSDSETQTPNTRDFEIPLPRRPINNFGRPGTFFDPLGGVGRGDLDPFSGGGGMLFPGPGSELNPFGGSPRFPGLRFPPPPGARFDPLDPRSPGSNRIPEPDPDHFRPSHLDDDMYS